jgi:hypothetical protein
MRKKKPHSILSAHTEAEAVDLYQDSTDDTIFLCFTPGSKYITQMAYNYFPHVFFISQITHVFLFDNWTHTLKNKHSDGKASQFPLTICNKAALTKAWHCGHNKLLALLYCTALWCWWRSGGKQRPQRSQVWNETTYKCIKKVPYCAGFQCLIAAIKFIHTLPLLSNEVGKEKETQCFHLNVLV